MTEKGIYEIARMLEDTEAVEQEFRRAMNVLRGNVETKYVDKIHAVVRRHQQIVREHPSREVVLLKALREFTDENSIGSLNRAIETLQFLDTARSVGRDISELSALWKAGSIQMSSQESSKEGPQKKDNTVELTGLLLTLALCGKL